MQNTVYFATPHWLHIVYKDDVHHADYAWENQCWFEITKLVVYKDDDITFTAISGSEVTEHSGMFYYWTVRPTRGE